MDHIRLSYIEEQGLIVCQLDGAGRRIVTLVELAWTSARGDPDTEEGRFNFLRVPRGKSVMGKAVGEVFGTSGQELEIIAIS